MKAPNICLIFILDQNQVNMIEITSRNGVLIRWDDRIQVGSIITAYRPGYHIVTKIEERYLNAPLIYFRTLINSKGKKSRNISEKCCASWCRLASDALPEHIKVLEEYITNLKNFKAEYDL
jgi:hypothetical protein